MKAIFLFAFLSCTILTSAQSKLIKDPISESIADESKDTGDYIHVLHRIIGDFNGDGRKDMAISNSSSWGNAGGEWLIYLKQKGGKYKYYTKTAMHSKAYAIIHRKKKHSILITYGRSSCCSGSIAYEAVTPKGLKLLKTKTIGEKEHLPGEEIAEIVGKELNKGIHYSDYTAELNCLLSKKKNCWQKID